MPETIKVNFALEPATVERIETLAQETHRGKSDVIDWLVEEAWNRIKKTELIPEPSVESAAA